MVAILAISGCGGDDSTTEESHPTQPAYTGHLKDLYDQQRAVCKTEAKFNTVEYREQHGATDPERYAEYAATHGFYEVSEGEELDAAVAGCLAGLGK